MKRKSKLCMIDYIWLQQRSIVSKGMSGHPRVGEKNCLFSIITET
jgi:hypothetical protein